MTATTFIDTHVLLYAASNALDDRAKRDIAPGIEAAGNRVFRSSVQEFYAAAVTKQRLQMTHDEAVAVLQSLAAFPVWPTLRELVLAAIDAKQRHQLSYWDAAILVAARHLGCQTLYSEDLSHGRAYDGVLVVNPFASDVPASSAGA